MTPLEHHFRRMSGRIIPHSPHNVHVALEGLDVGVDSDPATGHPVVVWRGVERVLDSTHFDEIISDLSDAIEQAYGFWPTSGAINLMLINLARMVAA